MFRFYDACCHSRACVWWSRLGGGEVLLPPLQPQEQVRFSHCHRTAVVEERGGEGQTIDILVLGGDVHGGSD